ERMILVGTIDGHGKAAEMSRGRLRAILESARGIKPDDMSPAARSARTVELKEFDGVRFVARIGIEKGAPKNDGSGDNYPDKNVLAAVITPDRKEWQPVTQMPSDPPFSGGGASTSTPTPAAISRPTWTS